jgi:hypothetical protein
VDEGEHSGERVEEGRDSASQFEAALPLEGSGTGVSGAVRGGMEQPGRPLLTGPHR